MIDENRHLNIKIIVREFTGNEEEICYLSRCVTHRVAQVNPAIMEEAWSL
jgi:hypothetical protein